MTYQPPPMSGTRDFILALGRALFPGLNFASSRSYHAKWSTFLSGAISQLHAHLSSAKRDLHPLTAGDGKPIEDWGAALNVTRKAATPARKSASGRVRGNAAATVTPGTQLRHPQSGLLYQIANASTVTVPGLPGDPDSFIDADIAAVDVGSQTRLVAGSSLFFLSPPPGIEPEVKLQLDLDEDGFDREQFGSYRSHVLGALSATPSGGNQGDFATWVEQSLPAVRRGYAYPNRGGRGTIDVAGFYAASGSSRALTAADRDAVRAYIETKAGFHITGNGGGLRVLETIPDPQTVEILVTPTGTPAYQFDWSGSLTVLSWTASTRELRFTAALPSQIRPGSRIIPIGTLTGSGAGSQDGREYRVEAVTGSDKVTLEVAPPVAPAANDIVYPGGPLVAPIRDAIVAHLNGELVYAGKGQLPIPESKAFPTVSTGQSLIGIDVLADGIGPANPGGKYNDTVSWSGGIVRATLAKIAAYKAGVMNINIIQPASDYEATDDAFPNDDQIHYITPSVVLIRSA